MNGIDLSIVIPIYNVEKYLTRCLESICHQDNTGVEIICVDDGSTDDGIKICQSYVSRIPNLKIIKQENAGVSVARNRGMLTAIGEWVWFVDPDDWIEDSAINTIRTIIRDSIDMIVFGFYHVWTKEIIRVDCGGEEQIINLNDDYETAFRLKESLIRGEKTYIGGYSGVVWNCLYRREYLLQNNIIFDEKLRKTQDVVFNLEVLDTKPCIKFVNSAMYYYFHNGDSICNRYMPNAFDRITPLLEAIYNYIQKQDVDFDSAFRMRCTLGLYTILQLDVLHRENPQSWFQRKKRWKEIKRNQWFKDCFKIKNIKKMSLRNRIKFILAKTNSLRVLSFCYQLKSQDVFAK